MLIYFMFSSQLIPNYQLLTSKMIFQGNNKFEQLSFRYIYIYRLYNTNLTNPHIGRQMRPNDSYSKSYDRDSSHATATKSPDRRVNQTQTYTPTRFSRKPSDRVNQLKNTLNECIDNLSNKRDTNHEAIQQVKQVNKQLLDTLSTAPLSQRGYLSSRRPPQQYRIPQYSGDYSRVMNDPRQQKQRDIVTLSSFHLAPADNIYRQSQSNFHMSQVYRPESVLSTHTTEVEDIRARIRNQRVENQQLQRQLQALRKEQQQLSSSSSYSANTPLGETSYLMSENSRLRGELSRLQTQQNLHSIYEEFIKLKQDNERLRKQTINMLKNGKY